jgi:hypothetical protein
MRERSEGLLLRDTLDSILRYLSDNYELVCKTHKMGLMQQWFPSAEGDA